MNYKLVYYFKDHIILLAKQASKLFSTDTIIIHFTLYSKYF